MSGVDLAALTDETSVDAVLELLVQLEEAQQLHEAAGRRVGGIRKMIEAVVEVFPVAEDVLPEDFDGDEEPRPRGAEAVRRVLQDNEGKWYGVPAVVNMLERRDWMPRSSNPANAVRSALQRLYDAGTVEKGKSAAGGGVIYMFPATGGGGYNDDEEPF
ncbi:MAG: hypothetical protein JOY78_05250 [Pseudonocardia sp.]|nr:hypothetical protein [Pseudonocardia sp.]